MEQLLILSLVFFAISTLFSMIGMGGGILYVPILLFAGYTMKQAPAISLILITATSLSALFTFLHNGKVDWKLALIIDPPTDIMAFVGGYFSSLIPATVLKMVLAGILIIASILMLKNNNGIKQNRRISTGKWYWHRNFNGESYSVNLIPVLITTGFIGLLSGMLGITGGIIKLPIMVLLCGVPMDIAIATSTVMVAITALSGLLGHAINGSINWQTGIILAIAAIIGGLLGSRISLSTQKKQLKRLFGIIILLISLHLIVKIILQAR